MPCMFIAMRPFAWCSSFTHDTQWLRAKFIPVAPRRDGNGTLPRRVHVLRLYALAGSSPTPQDHRKTPTWPADRPTGNFNLKLNVLLPRARRGRGPAAGPGDSESESEPCFTFNLKPASQCNGGHGHGHRTATSRGRPC